MRYALLLTTLLAGLFLAPLGATAQTLYVKPSDEGYLNMRDGPGTRHDVLRRLSPGDRVDIEETIGKWARIRLPSGQEGWVSADYLERGAQARGVLRVKPTVTGYLNLRDGPGTDRAILRRIYPGDRLAALGSRGDWIMVRHPTGAQGWVHGDYLTD